MVGHLRIGVSKVRPCLLRMMVVVVALSHRDHPLSKREREKLDRERIKRDAQHFEMRSESALHLS
jgi:hypothetical protein